ncbi:hypothetical protein [Parabacteroides sp.]
MDPITIGTGLIIFIGASLKLLIERYERMSQERDVAVAVIAAMGEETQQVLAQHKSSHADEPCDIKMQKACSEVLKQRFPQGVDEKFASLVSLEERRAFMENLAKDLAKALQVELYEVAFSEGHESLCGCYRYKDPKTGRITKTIWVNDLYLVKDPKCAIGILLHELRHAVQSESVYEDNKWNISVQRRTEWMYSNSSYVSDTAAYSLQSNEIDAEVFKERTLNLFFPSKKERS